MAEKAIEAMVAEALGKEPDLGKLLSYQQEEDGIQLDFEHGTAKFGLAPYYVLQSAVLA